MEIHQIRYFLALSRTLNFTRAARECNVSQPALTRAIKILEDSIGGELVRREREHSHLTELGKQMLPFLQKSYECLLEAKAIASTQKVNAAALRIALSPNASLSPVIGHLKRIGDRFPAARIAVEVGTRCEVLQKLKGGAVELAIAEDLTSDWNKLEAWALSIERFVMLISETHRLANRQRVEVKELADANCIWLSGCESMRAELDTCLSGRINHTELVLLEDVVALARIGMGCAILPAGVARPEGLVAVEISGLEVHRQLALHAVRGRLRTAPAAMLVRSVKARMNCALPDQFTGRYKERSHLESHV
jgi:DNA-binding transcriptional LysR family regulator